MKAFDGVICSSWSRRCVFLAQSHWDAPLDVYDTQLSKIITSDLRLNLSGFNAVDVSPSGHLLAIATSLGGVRLYSNQWGWAHPEESYQAADVPFDAIRSLAFVNETKIVFTNSFGGFLWPIHGIPAPLDGCRTDVVRLCKAESELVGLAAAGALQIWSLPGALLKTSLKAERPSGSCMDRLLYWPAARSCVYRSSIGSLVRVEMSSPQHWGWLPGKVDAYDVSRDGKHLITVDNARRTIYILPSGTPHRPQQRLRVAVSIRSICVTGDNPLELLALDSQGRVNGYVLRGDELCLQCRFPQGPYTTMLVPNRGPKPKLVPVEKPIGERYRDVLKVAPPPPVEHKPARAKQPIVQRDTAPPLVTPSPPAERDPQHVALMDKAKKAQREGDLPAELAALAKLTKLLGAPEPDMMPTWIRCAQLYERFWRLTEAKKLYEKIQERSGTTDYEQDINRLSVLGTSLRHPRSLVEPTESTLEAVIEAALLLDRSFRGRLLLVRGIPLKPSRRHIAPDLLVEKYRELQKEAGEDMRRTVRFERALWMTREKTEAVSLVVAPPERFGDLAWIQLAVRITDQEYETVLEPFALLDASHRERGTSKDDHARSLLKFLEAMGAGRLGDPWQGPTGRKLLVAMRSALNHVLAAERQNKTDAKSWHKGM